MLDIRIVGNEMGENIFFKSAPIVYGGGRMKLNITQELIENKAGRQLQKLNIGQFFDT